MAVLLSWNVAGRVRAVPDQAAALAAFPADVVALQEVRATAYPAWQEALAAAGYPHVHASPLPEGASARGPSPERYERRDRSWVFPHGKGGWRLDHVLARGLEVRACEYVHAWREARLSDHSAIWADLCSPAAAAP